MCLSDSEDYILNDRLYLVRVPRLRGGHLTKRSTKKDIIRVSVPKMFDSQDYSEQAHEESAEVCLVTM
eukprot:m.56922 g.56922  ORF g.56922 m.56922 type:complete len:68 (+) comp34664_c1_seq3:162-365(+)